MRIFISWWKPLSKSIAEAFAAWLPTVIQECRDPFVSTDISKGEAWFSTIVDELSEASIGVVFVTAENKSEPWLHFECGAMVKKLDRQKVCPVMVDIKKTDYEGPLTNLQLTEMFDKEDFFGLVKSINLACDHPLDEVVLREAFDIRWDRLAETAQDAVAQSKKSAPAKTQRSQADKIDEILEIVRDIRSANPTLSEMVEQIEHLSPRRRSPSPALQRAMQRREEANSRIAELGFNRGDLVYKGKQLVGVLMDIVEDENGRPLVMAQNPGNDEPTAHPLESVRVLSRRVGAEL